MKGFGKALLVFTIAAAVVGILLGGISAGFLYTDKERTPLTVAEFVAKMKSHEYTITDITAQKDKETYQRAIQAKKDQTEVIFCLMKTEQDAIDNYDKNRDIFAREKQVVGTITENAEGNFSFYKQNSRGSYCVISRIENTYIYIRTDHENEEEMEELLSELGY